ncbi:serine hydrolase [Mycobacterium sp. ITM-2016-00318]|uniref:serine hydrolase domain-containing protein n=1 Tax=Mycobacterium sp. ITM-2016-00318 TaxID=2099693 RepID=UPI000CF89D37|nr:serine hydrolase [Mycobacterium sp. ITM-2016-00318]WNG94724.1 serine hydrolase [Mycobacterium sp. ITM-2016-00318]
MALGGDTGRVPPGVTLANWQSAPQLHWAFQHVAEFLPTAVISRGTGPVAEMSQAPTELAGIPLYDRTNGRRTTVGEVMDATITDGWMVTQHGKLLGEHYYGGMTADSPHILMSVSKTLVATVVGALVSSGAVNPDAPVTHYVPALAESGYAGATVRNLLDMRSGIKFSEDYQDPMAEVRLIEQAIGWAPRTVADLPSTMYDFLVSLRQKSPHGGPFEYRSCETDVLGWICEAAGGMRMPELMSQLLWSKLGARINASIGVDSVGTGMFDGGINACMSDLVRVGSLFLNGGTSATGERVVSLSWIADTFAGGLDSRTAFAASPRDTGMPGGMYRNQVWFPYPGNNVLVCTGIHGQLIYVNRAADMVAAKLSSWPLPEDPGKLFPTIAAFDEIATQLS